MNIKVLLGCSVLAFKKLFYNKTSQADSAEKYSIMIRIASFPSSSYHTLIGSFNFNSLRDNPQLKMSFRKQKIILTF